MGIDFFIYSELMEVVKEIDSPCKMMEFGAQRLVLKTFPKTYPCKKFAPDRKICGAKSFFESLGIKHTSVDIVKEWGCEYMDLSKLQNKWESSFDIVTNFGTTEHIVGGQYQAFKNCHNFAKQMGFMMHVVPKVGRIQRRHPVNDTVYYERHFFSKLAELNGYKILKDTVYGEKRGRGGNLFSALQKVDNNPFISEEIFWKINGIKDLSKNKTLTNGKGI